MRVYLRSSCRFKRLTCKVGRCPCRMTQMMSMRMIVVIVIWMTLWCQTVTCLTVKEVELQVMRPNA